MDEGFNPYAEWLGVANPDRPDHYALLGLKDNEADGLRIAEAADRRIAQLRKTATKERLALAQRVAKEIVAARNCLLSTADKAAYDAKLRAAGPSAKPAILLPPKAYDDTDEIDVTTLEDEPLTGIPIPAESDSGSPPPALAEAPPVVAAFSAVAAQFAVTSREVPAARRRGSKVPLLIGGIAIGLLGVAAAVLVPKWLSPPAEASATPAQVAAVTPVETKPTVERPTPWSQVIAETQTSAPATEQEPETPVEPSGEPAGTEPDPPIAEPSAAMPATVPAAETPPAETPMTPAETPATARASWMLTPEQAAANVTATQESVAAVRRAMAQGEMDKAVEQIDLAELDAIENEAINQVGDTRAMLEYLRGFWRAVDEGFKELKAGQEFEFEGRTCVVVERTPERLVIRSSGRNRGYERRKLPPEVALFLATRWLKADDANTPLFLAAFHVFDADGDHQEARRLLEAANAAKTGGAAELLAELDAAAPKN